MSNISFQLIIDTQNIFLSQAPDKGRIRANLTGLNMDQVDVIVDGIIDAGPDVVNHLKKCLKEKTDDS
ncbi:MAG: hypothetical protein JJ953_11740 [Gracilimonas sp.]|uniref:hypothetical protein n=1 Tax=Gracilimonas sp. TaxID=1974203 RepID=UPI001B159953|nr:hypothetical protein [Gracilimonas sp.]MBO6586770.1 hypothetical protein [Gracilimonas sp.]MBO6615427.1 hypothetical protein [Gracilimonas sp.]